MDYLKLKWEIEELMNLHMDVNQPTNLTNTKLLFILIIKKI